MDSILSHLDRNFLLYDRRFDFSICLVSDENFIKMGLHPPIFINGPLPKKLIDKRIYIFLYDKETYYYHYIYHYGNGLIFNPSCIRNPINFDENGSPYNFTNICDYNFDPSLDDYESFYDFLGESRNVSAVMNCLKINETENLWVLMIYYFEMHNFNINQIEDYIKSNGKYKNNSWNKIHYLCLFIAFFHINITDN